MKTSIVAIAAAALGSAFVMTSSLHAQPVPPDAKWEVLIEVYSGRPNPVFTLTAGEIAEVRRRLGGAGPLPGDPNVASILPSILGYRGFVVTATADKKHAADVEVSKGKILRRAPDARAILDDRPVALERYLLSLVEGRKLLPKPIIDEIASSLP